MRRMAVCEDEFAGLIRIAHDDLESRTTGEGLTESDLSDRDAEQLKALGYLQSERR